MEVKGDLNIDGTLTVNNAPVTGGSGLANVVEDLTPQLGGDLDTNGKQIVTPNVTGGDTPTSIFLTPGDADVRGGGSVEISGGDSNTGTGGGLDVAGGNSVDADGGSITLFGGASTNANGGSILIAAGPGAISGGSVELGANNGNISLNAATIQVFSTAPVNFLGSGIDFPGHITNVIDPIAAQDAATKHYVDNKLQQFYNNMGGSSGGLSAVVDDPAPKLGGDLDVNNKFITGVGDINLRGPANINILSAHDGSGHGSISILTDLAFYVGADSAGITIQAGVSSTANGGDVSIGAGLATTNGLGGTVNIVGGDSNSGTAGSVTIAPGASVSGPQGSVSLGLGTALGSTVDILDPLNMHSNQIHNVTNPSSAQDAATKSYVDGIASGSSPGFYGIVWSDGVVTKRTDRLSFGNQYFYLDGRKPTLNIKESGISHSLLSNLSNDDHPQYIRVDGTRAFTGSQSMGGNRITSVGAPQAATDVARLADVNNGFYGIFIRESDGNPAAYRKDTIIFDSSSFYLNSDSKGIPMVSFRGTTGGTGITGIDINDGVHNITNKTKINLNLNAFYLSQTSNGDPMVNLKYDKDLYPIYIDFPTTQQIAVDTWAQYAYTIEKVDFDCFSGSATGGFYIIRAANRATARDGIQVTAMDPLPISTTPTTRFATANNNVQIGDVVQFSLYQNSSARRVRLMLTVKKS